MSGYPLGTGVRPWDGGGGPWLHMWDGGMGIYKQRASRGVDESLLYQDIVVCFANLVNINRTYPIDTAYIPLTQQDTSSIFT